MTSDSPPGATQPSKSQVSRAGSALAGFSRDSVDLTSQELITAITVVDAWRQSHVGPLEWVTDRLGSRIAPAVRRCAVAQRLKRMPQIVKKLARYETMKLAQMQDLGGSRIVLADLDDVNEAARLIESYARNRNRWEVRHMADYREEGRPDTAYRALHIVVMRDERLIEIQLRTQRQHAWAEAAERVTALSDHDVKEGQAPTDFLEYFRVASDGFSLLDRGQPVSPRHRQRFRYLHKSLGRYVMDRG